MIRETEVCVIGGGPAGAACARRLAQLGHRVCVVERAAFPRSHVGESLPPSILPALDALGLRARVEAAGFLRPTGALVDWAGASERLAFGTAQRGFQVDRGRFDQLLLDAASEAGAEILQPARAYHPRLEDGLWHIPLRDHGQVTGLRARLLIDAAGRQASGLARAPQPLGVTTAALYGYWDCPEGIGPETRIEAGQGAWYWGAALPDGSFNATVFLDPARLAGLTPPARLAFYRDLLEASQLLRPCLKGALRSPVLTCDATSQRDSAPAEPQRLRVGDAGFCVDPLSSQGVQMALRSGLQGAIAAHTILTRPERAASALRFLRARVQEAAQTHAPLAASHYARQHDHSPAPFWQARSATTPDPVRPKPIPPDHPLRLCPQTQFADVPVIDGDLIAESAGLTHPNLTRPVVWYEGHPLATLMHAFRQGMTARDLARIWPARSLAPWLWQHRVLIPQ